MLNRVKSYLVHLEKQNKKTFIGLSAAVFLLMLFLIVAISLPVKDLLFARYYTKPSSLAAGNTYYTATTGSDNNPGTQAAPFRTITKGASVLTPGDTLLVQPGTYTEALLDAIPSGTDWNTPVTIKAADPANRPVLFPAAGPDRVLYFGTINGVGQHHIVIDGFVVDATHIGIDAVKISYDGPDDTKAAHHIRLINSEIRNAPRMGILLTSRSARFNELINLDVHNNGTTDFDHGVYDAAPDNLIEGSTYHDNAGWGIHVYDGNYPAENTDNTIVRNNLVYNNARVGNRGVGIGVYSGANSVVYNNIVWGNNQGIAIDYYATNTKIYNNTLYNNSRNTATRWSAGNIIIGTQATGTDIVNNSIVQHTNAGIYNTSPAGSNNIARNNLLFNNTIYNANNTLTLQGNLLSTDPLFIDPLTNNFHHQSNSPAINSGATLTAVSSDFDNNTRPQGSAYDIGAYEYISPVTPTVNSSPAPSASPTASVTPLPPSASLDTINPTVSISSPLNGSTVKRGSVITIKAAASDNIGVTKVEFSVNGSLYCTDTVAPYTCAWSVAGKPNKVYTLTAKAYDAANNNTSATIQVTAK